MSSQLYAAGLNRNSLENRVDRKRTEHKHPEYAPTDGNALDNADAQDTDAQDIDRQIEWAIAQLATGDFHSRWDQAKRFSLQFSEWGDRSVPPLIRRLKAESDPDTQWFLVRILGQFEHPTIVEALAQLLITTPHETLQIEAGKALVGLGESAIAILTSILGASANDQPVSKPVSTERRLLAARTLSHIRRSDTIAPLLSIVDDPDPRLREIATEALGSFHDDRITPLLLKALEDEPAICIEAIRALGRRRDLLSTVDLARPLAVCLHSKREAVACESAIALGRLGHEAATTVLGEGLASPLATPVKLSIVQALGWLDTATAVTCLAEAFEQPVPVMMPPVKQAIARALGHTADPALQAIAAQPLLSWLKTASAQSPHQSGDTDLMQTILSTMSRLKAVEALSSLIPILSHPDLKLRIHALNALKQIDPRAAQTEIQAYLRQESLSPIARRNVVEALSTW